MIYFPEDKIYLDVLLFIIFVALFPFCCFAGMIYTLTDFSCLDISILFIFLIFCLSGFIHSCKSNVDFILEPNLAIYHKKISSLYSPDSKSPSFRTDA